MFQFFTDMIAAPVLWFMQIVEASGMTGYFLGAFMITIVIRTLLAPVLGHAGSDRAKRSRSKED